MVWVRFGGGLGVDWVVIWVDLGGLGGDLGGFGGGLVWMFLGLCGCGGGLGADFGLGVDVVWMFLVFRKKNEEKKNHLAKITYNWVWEDEDGGFGDPLGLGR